MLQTSQENLANTLSIMLMHEGTGLSIKAETPLDTLVCSMDPLMQDNLESATKDEPFLSRHNVALAKTIDVAFDRLMANRNFARNTINPIIRDIAERCDELRARTQKENDIFDMDIAVVEPLRIFSSTRLEEGFSPFSDAQYLSFPENKATFSMREDFQIDMFIKATSGNNDLWNNAVGRMLLTVGNDPLAFNSLIGDSAKVSEEQQGRANLLRNPMLVLNFLYVDAIINGTYPTDKEYDKNELARIKGWYGLQLSRQINSIRDFASDNKLFLVGPDPKTIYVYKRRWEKVSGLVTARELIGCWITQGKSVVTGNSIFSQSDANLTEAIAGMGDNLDTRERSNNFLVKVTECNKLTELIEYGIGDVIRNVDIVDDVDQDLLFSLTREFFDNNTITTSTDILDFIRRAVCYTVGHDSSALQLLSDIETYLDNNPEASLDKADIYASTRIVVQWLMNQTEVVGVASTQQLLRNEI